jgi:hypothetical protein
MKAIQDLNRYTELMKNGFMDKLFWVDKLFEDWNSIVDYGSADGTLAKAINDIFPDKKVIGYDNSEEMVGKAYEQLGLDRKNIMFTTDLMSAKGDVLYLSSIIHEVYSYCSAEQIDAFWKYVFDGKFKYIIIRDMIYDEDIQRASHVNQVMKVHTWANKTSNEKYLKEFERLWGRITEYKNLVHFLLKFKYQIGWEREVRENYLPLSIQHLYELIPPTYRIEFAEHYTLPYFKHEWEKEMDLYIDEKIHSKFIIKKIK